MDHGYTRPRYNGYLYFQDHAGAILQKCLMGNDDAANSLNEMNLIYKQSLQINKSVSI
jgi:multiple sugar transport system substrate-binding protein